MRASTVITGIAMLLIFGLAYSIALALPVFALYALPPVTSTYLWLGSFLNAALVLLLIVLELVSLVIVPGLFWRLLPLRYSGKHEFTLNNKQIRKWLLTEVLYLPVAVVLNLFHIYPLKNIHARLFGAKLGRRVTLGGLVTDPSLLTVGDNAFIGGFSMVMGHAVERGIITFDRVFIGKKCEVGSRALILPGAKMEDNSLLGALSLLPKYRTIPTGTTYGGVPARQL